MKTPRIAVFAGSFDPFTVGHEDIVTRGLEVFDEIVVAIGVNSEKKNLFSAEERVKQIEKVFAGRKNVRVETYQGLTIDYAKKIGATHILRGIRTSMDLEYERPIADLNRKIGGIDTVFLLASPEHQSVSSSIVRELMRYKSDVSGMVPEVIVEMMKTKMDL